MTRRQKWFVALGCAAPVLLVIGAVTVIWVAIAIFDATTTDLPVSDEDLSLILTPEIMSEHFELAPDPMATATTKKRFFDGSWEVELNHEEDDFVLYSSLNAEVSAADAGATYLGVNLGLGLNGLDLREQRWSGPQFDQQKFHTVHQPDGSLIGNSLVAREGNRVFVAFVVGAAVETSEEFAEICDAPITAFLDPKPTRQKPR